MEKKMKVAVNGALGAMGRRIIHHITEAEDMVLAGAIEGPKHPQVGKDVGLAMGLGTLGVNVTSELTAPADVVIDFSVPKATMPMARACAESQTAMVIGTTGLSQEAQDELRSEVSLRAAILVAANMSLGVNLLMHLVEAAARALPAGYDVEIVEAHHRRKKDAPSGTAMALANRLLEALGRDASELRHGRQGQVGARTATEIGVHAVRGGDIVGNHTVMFAGGGERIELTHRATTRDVFVVGALQAARFLTKQTPGLYSMQDVLPWQSDS
jgi:4-hydroxy-tetrahydrodipicolinate reductase